MNTFQPVQRRDPDEGSELLEWLAMQSRCDLPRARGTRKNLKKECRLPGGLKNPAYKLGTTEKL